MSSAPPILIDVLSAESYQAEHLPGAVNFSVYEVAFVDKVRAAFPDPATPITLYGYSDTTAEAATALGKLRAAGYLEVTTLQGGLEGWKNSGGALEGMGLRRSADTGAFDVDPAASFIRWTGTNVMNFHHGKLSIGGGTVFLENGSLVGGKIVIDMNSLSCADLTDPALNTMLIHHLRSDDFFAVDRFPQAEFTITSSRGVDASPGLPNCIISGGLSLRGVSVPMEILATVAETADGGHTALAFPSLNRTLWGSTYGSGGFFSRIGMHLVNDLVQLHLHVVTRPRS